MLMLIRAFPKPLDQLHDWHFGDSITHLDGRPVEDIIDLYYYTPESNTTTLTIKRKEGDRVIVTMNPEDIDAVTGCFAPMEFKTCAAQCVFCFIDQNPTGMRDQIYVKDEDYRFSFLYGNYITLTSLGKRGLKRIMEQKMSPLYVSVHATDIDVRTRMLGIKKRMDVVAILKELTEAGIETMLRGLAEEKQVGLGKVAQPLRVAICGSTISPPIFDSVKMLGKENSLARIDITLKKFAESNQ